MKKKTCKSKLSIEIEKDKKKDKWNVEYVLIKEISGKHSVLSGNVGSVISGLAEDLKTVFGECEKEEEEENGDCS